MDSELRGYRARPRATAPPAPIAVARRSGHWPRALFHDKPPGARGSRQCRPPAGPPARPGSAGPWSIRRRDARRGRRRARPKTPLRSRNPRAAAQPASQPAANQAATHEDASAAPGMPDRWRESPPCPAKGRRRGHHSSHSIGSSDKTPMPMRLSGPVPGSRSCRIWWPSCHSIQYRRSCSSRRTW